MLPRAVRYALLHDADACCAVMQVDMSDLMGYFVSQQPETLDILMGEPGWDPGV